jgi:hypothetical protein
VISGLPGIADQLILLSSFGVAAYIMLCTKTKAAGVSGLIDERGQLTNVLTCWYLCENIQPNFHVTDG